MGLHPARGLIRSPLVSSELVLAQGLPQLLVCQPRDSEHTPLFHVSVVVTPRPRGGAPKRSHGCSRPQAFIPEGSRCGGASVHWAAVLQVRCWALRFHLSRLPLFRLKTRKRIS